jgi:Regulator of G protein signaling domain
VAQVNLDFECRDAIEAELENATAALFDEAEYFVLDLIKYDLYLKFIESDIYRNFKGIIVGWWVKFSGHKREVLTRIVV